MLQEAMRKKRAGEGGFTLIELLIVIVILGVLAAVVVFAVGGITDKGKASACKSDLKTVETAQEAYYAGSNLGNGTYAASVAALVTAKLLRERSQRLRLHDQHQQHGCGHGQPGQLRRSLAKIKTGEPGDRDPATGDVCVHRGLPRGAQRLPVNRAVDMAPTSSDAESRRTRAPLGLSR